MTGLRKHREEGSLPLDARFQYGNGVKVSRITKTKKAPVFRLRLNISGGVDGTRTRDPRRDRPVF